MSIQIRPIHRDMPMLLLPPDLREWVPEDDDSRLMRKNRRAEFRQSYNAQAAVDADGSQLIFSAHVTTMPVTQASWSQPQHRKITKSAKPIATDC